MNCIRKIEVKDDSVYMSCTRFGISNENFKNEVLSNIYKRGGQPALDKAIISMLLNKLCPVELGGDDPSILPYKKAIETAKQQRVLTFYQSKINQQYGSHGLKNSGIESCHRTNVSLKEYMDHRNKLTEEMLNAVTALIAR